MTTNHTPGPSKPGFRADGKRVIDSTGYMVGSFVSGPWAERAARAKGEA
jgi:hypothetical protein